ncbi:MAG: hydroxypyruvate reductase [Betaproteobacteria bacterium RIFCSPLOWO2_02_FULL_65_24]|nr:MAG: hydroxypyruvate reductase [Betaproteobacteria bacterium RIFCSPLOWO2_02_FULL_65_24]
MDEKDLLLRSFQAAVAAADPLKIVPEHLPAPPRGRTLVVGAGKAAAAMALAVEQHWPASAPLSGLVITRYGHGLVTRRIQVLEAGHPLPDEAGAAAARDMLRRVQELGPEDLLLALISGGGSALLSLPANGLSTADLKSVTRDLLLSGAPIQDINTVRKHVSAIQGGRLAASSRAPVVALIISDVAGDDATHIASGPCTADPSTYGDALDVLERHRIEAPRAIRDHLERGLRGEYAETPKPGDAALAAVENRLIATAHRSLQAAVALFEANGIPAAILSDSVTGEAAEVAKVHAAIARQVALHGEPWKAPVALLSGGECTVTVRGPGRGGRCSAFLLALGIELHALPGVSAIACDTDGIDGTEDNAGAILLPDSLARAAAAGIAPAAALRDNDSYGFFEKLSDLVVIGPTRTNVNDYRAIVIRPS